MCRSAVSNSVHLLVLATALLTACGSGGEGVADAVQEAHACDIVTGAEVSRLAEGTLVESNVDVERTSSSGSFSQCTHTLDGSHRRVTVQVRASGKPLEMSRQTDADEARASDDGTGYGVQFAEAIEAGQSISGLGDFAYTFEIGGTLYVVAYKDMRSAVRVWMPTGADGNEPALRIGKKIAQAALDQL
jgi:hypothetical protein